MVAHQGESAAGKLHPDLMGSAGVEPHMDQAGFAGGQAMELQTGVFDAFSLLFDGENFVLSAVLEEEILPIAIFRGACHGPWPRIL